MKISTKGRYALRLMIDLAQHNNEYVKLKDISERQGISEKYLEQITAALTKAGFIKGVRGAQGGYKLVRKASEYTVGSILRVTEGSLSPVACLDDEINFCPRKEFCITLNFWKGLSKVIDDYLDSKTLEDFLSEYSINGSDYII